MDRHGPCEQLSSWRLSVPALAPGGVDLSESFGYVGPSPPYVIGGVDFDGDGDGADVIWAHTSWSAAHTRVGLFAFRDGRLTAVRFEDGQVAEFDIGDRPKYPRGVACSDTGLVVASTAERDKPAWEPRVVDVRSYRLHGNVLHLVGAQAVPDDEAAASRWRFTCGPLTM